MIYEKKRGIFVKVIKTEHDYEQALVRLAELMDLDPEPGPDTVGGQEMEVLTVLIEKYESQFYPVRLPSVPEAIRFRLDQLGQPYGGLVPIFGSSTIAKGIMDGTRDISLPELIEISHALGIPPRVIFRKHIESGKITVHQYRRVLILIIRGADGFFHGEFQLGTLYVKDRKPRAKTEDIMSRLKIQIDRLLGDTK